MRNRFSLPLFALAFCIPTLFADGVVAQETVLHVFGGTQNDGKYPIDGLIRDASGNLYGVTGEGGTYGHGAAYELSPKESGGYTEKILHSFNLNGTDGAYPNGGMILDSAGDLFGTTTNGGTGTCGGYNCGIVFELIPQSNGTWKEKILYNFQNNGVDGTAPIESLVQDKSGNLYGVTYTGGTSNRGTVYQLQPKSGGVWSENILHSFSYNGKTNFDGSNPEASLTINAAGQLFGTTTQGGAHNYGTVFELVRNGGGWAEKIIHSFDFNGTDGISPLSGVTFDASGDMYGITNAGGAFNAGSLYELVAESGGAYSESILLSFDSNDGSLPYGNVIFDASGNLYGTATAGGSSGNGVLFELTPDGGSWNETILYAFPTGGYNPDGNIALDPVGNIYGTTQFGGSAHDGVVFEVSQ